ncbi:MAG TPA: alanine--tRNA ligase [Acidobacteria bacterium]|nr:alanine--tRNA ligase [Acidobacteriota bacterium]
MVPADRIVELGLEENFWAMGDTGPCGRCSELHYHRGNQVPCDEPVCRGIDCSCDRYVEIWNNVFMEFSRNSTGELTPLPAASIDTGMGLERIVAVLQDKVSNYDTDLFKPLLHALGEYTGHQYGPHTPQQSPGPNDVSMRVVADHLRAMAFLIADGVMPSNEWRGYVLRKIMRRAMRHGKRLGVSGPFLHELVDVLVDEMGPPYPELPANRDAIAQVVRAEEERFDAVLTDGLPRLESALAAAAEGGTLPGVDVFRLYDTHGLPVDFIEDLASERGITLDRTGFDTALDAQRQQSRSKASFGTAVAVTEFQFASVSNRTAVLASEDRFRGYETTEVVDALVVALFDDARVAVTALEQGTTGFVVLQGTPFYLEAGGQVSDTGRISNPENGLVAEVDGVERIAPGGPRAHHLRVVEGQFRSDYLVHASVDRCRRNDIKRNHTATHLLHAALQRELGTHVKQAGSLVAPDRLRFDFAHRHAITRNELDAIERRVNSEVYANHPVETKVQSTKEAIEAGAMALFGEKYGDSVRVVSVPSVSMELCGGTHCTATGDIGLFAITQESGVSAGVRRIEAVTGHTAVTHLQSQRASLDAVLGVLGVPEDRAVEAVQRIQGDGKRLARELDKLKMQAALDTQDIADDDGAVNIGDVRLIARQVAGLEKESLRGLADSLRDRLGSGVVILASTNAGKVALVVSVSKDLVDRVPAGRVVKAIAPIVGGGGGGRADFAQAGGRRPDKVDELLAEGQAVVGKMLNA